MNNQAQMGENGNYGMRAFWSNVDQVQISNPNEQERMSIMSDTLYSLYEYISAIPSGIVYGMSDFNDELTIEHPNGYELSTDAIIAYLPEPYRSNANIETMTDEINNTQMIFLSFPSDREAYEVFSRLSRMYCHFNL